MSATEGRDTAAVWEKLSGVQKRALDTLSASAIPFLIMRAPVPGEPVHDLDLLVDQETLQEMGRALRGAGLLPKSSPLGAPSKAVFTGYEGGRFSSLDIHTEVVSRGLVYLDANLLLARRVLRDGVPVLSEEDSLLHLVLHPLLGRREIGGKYSARIAALAAGSRDTAYMRHHLAQFGLERVYEDTLAAILGNATDAAEPLFARARARVCLRAPANVFRQVRYRLAISLRLRRRAALVVFVGVDGVGKSSLVGALERRLSSAGLRSSTAYLGSWGRYETKARWVRSFSLRDATGPESSWDAAVRGLKNLGKIPLFYGGLVFEQSVRYRRSVVGAHSHVVLADRYIYDLEVPFSRRVVRAGRRARWWIYRIFPAPDLIFHLQGEPHEIRARKQELREDQMQEFDVAYGGVLEGRGAIRLRVDALPEALADRIVEEHWRKLLEASWRASRTLLPSSLRRSLDP